MKNMKKVLSILSLSIILFACNTKERSKRNLQKETADSLFTASYYLNSRLGLPNEAPFSEVKGMIGVDLVTFSFNSVKVNRSFNPKSSKTLNQNATLVYPAINFTTSSDCFINDNKLLAGSYSLFTFQENDSTYILAFTIGTPKHGYDSSKSVLKIRRNSIKSDKDYGNDLNVFLSDRTLNSGIANIVWNNFKIDFAIKFLNADKILTSIKDYFKQKQENQGTITWDEYYEASKFCFDNSLTTTMGEPWIDSSIAINRNATNLTVKAKYLASNKNYMDAINIYSEVYKLIEKETPNNQLALSTIKQQIEGLKKYSNIRN
ncbi:DUF2911 domain-containing protein [Chitinophaga sp. Hz27]|uniref:DUF2911 domain-containing protein n=1 Tax=Chitinophaga sp. Hz27 TaxID=3347169 RepID=UPI0035D91BE5